MKRLINFLSHCKYLFLLLLTLGSALIVFAPKTAYAANESYLWMSNTAVEASGGDLQSSTTLRANAPNSTSFYGTFTYRTGCQFKIELLAFANGATLRIPQSAGGGGSNITNPCSADITQSYNGKTVTIQGTRPGPGNGDETQLQKHVSVMLASPSPASQSPSTITFAYKDAAGQTIGTTNSIQQTVDTNPNPGARVVFYTSGIDLEPGTYSVCPSAIIGCQSFTKVKYQGLSLSYGESLSSRDIEVKVELTFSRNTGQALTAGPLALSLQKADGTGVASTTQTNNVNLPADQNPSTVTSTISLAGTFNNVEAGTYKACLVAANACQNVTKDAGTDASVTIALSGSAAQNVINTTAQARGDWCKSNGGDAAWWLCGPVNIAADAVALLDCQILDLLKIDTVAIFDVQGTPTSAPPNCTTRLFAEGAPDQNSAASSNAYRTAWGAFRNIAYAILVILGLIMVASQVMGLDIFDAYTIRKMLPKLIIATIFLTLSWNIMQFLFTASNAAADAVMAIIEYPFRDINAANGASITNATLAWIIPTLLLGAGATGAVVGIGLLGFGGMLALLASLLIGAFSAWVLLVARDVAATALIIAAPLAIICAAYEPFERLYTFWRGILITILISVPTLAAILAMSHAAAFISLMGG